MPTRIAMPTRTAMPTTGTQRWHLIGLEPMHDAMIRRLATQERQVANRIEGVDANIEWTTSAELESWRDWTPVDSNEGMDVTVIHRDQLLAAVERLGAFERSQFLAPDNACRLRLLWSWFPLGLHDVSWSGQWMVSGVICEPRTLQSWIRIANRKGPLSPRLPHTLLRELKLPSL